LLVRPHHDTDVEALHVAATEPVTNDGRWRLWCHRRRLRRNNSLYPARGRNIMAEPSLPPYTLDIGDAFARPYRESDTAALCAAVRESGPSLAQWLDWYRPDYSESDAEQWITCCTTGWANGDLFAFALFDAADKQFLGAVGISHRNRMHNFAGIGYWTRVSARGRGLAARLGRRVAAFGFERVGLSRIEIVAAMDNFASRRTAEKIGARFEGVQRSRLRVGERMQDAAMYALVPKDLGIQR
jgi:RimJ/RimL family protein N-acetyltransferase